MDDAIRKHDGKLLLLYRRNGLYQARIHLGKGEYLHRSLKTANTAQAERLADDLWNDTRYELKKGLPVRKRTLNAVLDEYIRLRERDNEQGKQARSTATKYTAYFIERPGRRALLCSRCASLGWTTRSIRWDSARTAATKAMKRATE